VNSCDCEAAQGSNNPRSKCSYQCFARLSLPRSIVGRLYGVCGGGRKKSLVVESFLPIFLVLVLLAIRQDDTTISVLRLLLTPLPTTHSPHLEPRP